MKKPIKPREKCYLCGKSPTVAKLFVVEDGDGNGVRAPVCQDCLDWARDHKEY